MVLPTFRIYGPMLTEKCTQYVIILLSPPYGSNQKQSTCLDGTAFSRNSIPFCRLDTSFAKVRKIAATESNRRAHAEECGRGARAG